MRRSRENLHDRVFDAISGYAVLVLSILCFILALGVAIAAVRLIGGA